MNNLAYRAKGLQYFTYAHDEAMVCTEGSTTALWEMVKRINTEISTLAKVMKDLRSVGVYRTGPLWSGTKKHMNDESDSLSYTYWKDNIKWSVKSTALACVGDPVTLGYFLGPKDQLYVLVVNGNPCSWANVTMRSNMESEKLYIVSPKSGGAHELWPVNPSNQKVLLAPGEGRLFQVGG